MKRKLIGIAVLVLLALSLRGQVFAASSLQFSPSAKTVSQDTQFTINIPMQADQPAYAGNAVILYTSNDLQVISAVNGDFFDTFDYANDSSNGRLELHGYFINSTLDSKPGSGTFATVTFKAKRGTGTGTVSFSCPGDGTETFILKPDGSNQLSCSSLNTLTITYGSVAAPTATPTTPPGGGPNPTATPTPGPGGNSSPSCSGISFLPTGSISTFSTVTLYCQGNDPDGYMAGAEFEFGDGNLRIVNGTASDGKISTTYKYAKAGTYGITCKVKDNSGAWSGIPEICKSKVSVLAGQSSAGTGSSTGNTSGKTTGVTRTPTPTVNAMPEQIALIDYVSPTPAPTIAEKPETAEQPLAEENPFQKALLYLGGGILLIAILIILARKLRGDNKSNPPVMLPPTTF